MAGNEIYIGKMLEVFSDKMDTLSADMAKSVEAMRAVEAELVGVALNTSQAIDTVSIGQGKDYNVFLDAMIKTYQEVEGTTRDTEYILLNTGERGEYGPGYKIGEFSSTANGYVDIDFLGLFISAAKVGTASNYMLGFFANDGETEDLIIETDPIAISKLSNYTNITFAGKSGTFAISAKKNYIVNLKVKKTTGTDVASLQINAGAPISLARFPRNLIMAKYKLVNKVSDPIVAIF